MKANTQNTPRLHCNVIGDPKTIAHINHTVTIGSGVLFQAKESKSGPSFQSYYKFVLTKIPQPKDQMRRFLSQIHALFVYFLQT